MFNIGPEEVLLILVIALLVFGPQRLPEIARSIGRGLREFRRASDEAREQLLGATATRFYRLASGHRA